MIASAYPPPRIPSPPPRRRASGRTRLLVAGLVVLLVVAGAWLVQRKLHNDECARYSDQYWAALTEATAHLSNPKAMDEAFANGKVFQDKARAAHCHVPEFKDAFEGGS